MVREVLARWWGLAVLAPVVLLASVVAAVVRPEPRVRGPVVGREPARPALMRPRVPEGAAMMVYYLERYARNLEAKTEMDRALEQQLGTDPASRAVAMRLVNNFKAVPLEQRRAVFGELAEVDPNREIPADQARQRITRAAGVQVARVSPTEVRTPAGPALQRRAPSDKRRNNEGKPDILPQGQIGREPLQPASGLREGMPAGEIVPVGIRRPDVGRVPGTTLFAIQYAGLDCRDESDWDRLSNSDEPYVITVLVGPNGTKRSSQSPVYGDVDSGEVRVGPVSDVWPAGSAQDLTLVTTVMENDDGDPSSFRAGIETAVGYAIAAAKLYGISIPESVKTYVADFVVWLLGTGDDLIETQTAVLPAAAVSAFGSTPPAEWRGLTFHFGTRHQGGGADYRALYRVVSHQGGPILVR